MPAIEPMIHVPDVKATADWYASLGFTVTGLFEDCGEVSWARIALGDGAVMFNAGGQPSAAERREVDLYVTGEDVDALFARLAGKVDIVSEPYDAFHGNRELIIRDLNRFWITFAQPIPGFVRAD